MEPARFSIGVKPKGEKKRRPAKKSTALAEYPSYELNLRKKRWLILPDVPAHAEAFLYHAGETTIEIMQTIARHRRTLRLNREYKHPITRKILAGYEQVAFLNQKVRDAFSALARRWIRSRFRKGNEEDLVTGEVPKNPIVITDWAARRTYSFEPSTILRDMVSRLQMSICTVFSNAMKPRNPYTNMKLTEGQFYNVVEQLRAAKKVHWSLEGLMGTRYNIDLFQKQFHGKLKQTILHSLFSNPKNSAGNMILIGFIDDQYAAHGKVFENDTFEWAIETMPDAPRLREWRRICYDHYMKSTYTDVLSVEDLRKTYRLCTPPTELTAAMKKAHPPTIVSEETHEDSDVEDILAELMENFTIV